MPNTLPIELVDLILDQVGDPPTLYSDDRGRVRTLYACSFVCRGWRELALPKYWRKLDIESKDGADRLRRLGSKREWVEIVRVDERTSSERLNESIIGFTRLERLLFEGTDIRDGVWDLGMLAEFSNLRQLHLNWAVAQKIRLTLVFSSLVQLAISEMIIEEEDCGTLLCTTALPALRALSLDAFSSSSRSHYSPALPASFLHQLDMLQVSGPFLRFPSTVLHAPTPFLYLVVPESQGLDNIFRDLMHQAPPHVGVEECHEERHRVNWCDLPQRFQELVQSTSKPHSLLLPISLLSAPTPPVTPHLVRLLESCAEQDVDIVWHRKAGAEGAIVQEFWAYARRLKAKEAAKRADKEASGRRE